MAINATALWSGQLKKKRGHCTVCVVVSSDRGRINKKRAGRSRGLLREAETFAHMSFVIFQLQTMYHRTDSVWEEQRLERSVSDFLFGPEPVSCGNCFRVARALPGFDLARLSLSPSALHAVGNSHCDLCQIFQVYCGDICFRFPIFISRCCKCDKKCRQNYKITKRQKDNKTIRQ